MSKIGVGKPIVQSAEIQQAPDTLVRQLLAYGNSAQAYSAFQTGPGELLFTRTFWPVSYIVIAVVGFLLCLIGPLILLLNQTETLTIRVTPGSTPGSSVVAVSGVADPEMMGWLMALLGQGRFIANAGEVGTGSPVQTELVMSDDRAYWWDGTSWNDARSTPPPHAHRSPDGQFWWDGAEWRS